MFFIRIAEPGAAGSFSDLFNIFASESEDRLHPEASPNEWASVCGGAPSSRMDTH